MTERRDWSCEERSILNCRNAHGCHCKEIAALKRRLEKAQDDLSRALRFPRKGTSLPTTRGKP